jgi:hypothetical protein
MISTLPSHGGMHVPAGGVGVGAGSVEGGREATARHSMYSNATSLNDTTKMVVGSMGRIVGWARNTEVFGACPLIEYFPYQESQSRTEVVQELLQVRPCEPLPGIQFLQSSYITPSPSCLLHVVPAFLLSASARLHPCPLGCVGGSALSSCTDLDSWRTT